MTQTLFRAGNESPSEAIRRNGLVYGFSNLNFARGWKNKNKLDNIYQFTTSKYKLDTRRYLRDTEAGKEYSDNEYICYDILSERFIEKLRTTWKARLKELYLNIIKA